MGKSRSRSKGRKGKKGKKKADLTDEEKRKLAEQKALAEREKLVARQNLTKAFLKVKKDKEYELVKLNNNKILDLWRPHLRKQKIKELMEEFKHMREAFEKAFDKKSQWVQDLDRTLNGNEGDYAEATDGHLYQVDKMMEFYEMRIKEVIKMYDEAKTDMYTALEFERKRIQELHKAKMDYLRHGIKELAESVARADKEARAEQYAKLVELRTKGNHELYLYRSIMTEKLNNIWSDLHLKILGYINMNVDKKNELIELLAKDEEMSRTIEDLFKRRTILVDGIREMKRKRELFVQAFDLYMFNIREVRDTNRLTYNRLQTTRKKTLLSTQASLMDLALVVHDVNEGLSTLVDKRERVVILVGRILEAENEAESVDPFLRRWGLGGKIQEEWEAEVSDEASFHADKGRGINRFSFQVNDVVHRFGCDCSKCRCEGNEDPEVIGLAGPINSMLKTYGKLERFWIRFNKVALEKEALQRQRQSVLKDNRDLKICVRHYMAGMNPPALEAFNFPPPAPQIIEENTRRIHDFMEMKKEAKLRAKCNEKGLRKLY